MSDEQAFEALKDGDFILAVPLFEQAARETGYTSDVINHALTLALYHPDKRLGESYKALRTCFEGAGGERAASQARAPAEICYK